MKWQIPVRVCRRVETEHVFVVAAESAEEAVKLAYESDISEAVASRLHSDTVENFTVEEHNVAEFQPGTATAVYPTPAADIDSQEIE